MDTPSLAVAGGSLALSGVVWLLRLEGRVNTHEAECAIRETRRDEQHAEMTKKLDAIAEKLDRLVERQ